MHLIHLLLVGANQVTAPAPTIFDLITNALAYSVIIPIALFVYF
jgi:hypothetical protein